MNELGAVQLFEVRSEAMDGELYFHFIPCVDAAAAAVFLVLALCFLVRKSTNLNASAGSPRKRRLRFQE